MLYSTAPHQAKQHDSFLFHSVSTAPRLELWFLMHKSPQRKIISSNLYKEYSGREKQYLKSHGCSAHMFGRVRGFYGDWNESDLCKLPQWHHVLKPSWESCQLSGFTFFDINSHVPSAPSLAQAETKMNKTSSSVLLSPPTHTPQGSRSQRDSCMQISNAKLTCHLPS